MANNNPSAKFRGFDLPTTTPVPDQVFDVLMDDLTGAELKVLLYICRRTFGFKKNSDNISLNQMINGIKTKQGKVLDRGTGLSRDSVARVIKSLEAKDVIIRNKRQSVKRGNEATTYSLNFLNGSGTPQSDNRTRGGGKIGLGLVRLSDSQQTVLQETVEQHDVVVQQQLENFGISKTAATKLAKDYPEELILDKLNLAQWLVSTGSPAVSKNPAGWLRKAIEEDYAPPKGYESPRQRKAKSEESERLAQRAANERKIVEQEFHRVRAETAQKVKEEYPAQPIGDDGLTTESAWALTLKKLEGEVSPAKFQTFLKDSRLFKVEGRAAHILVQTPFAATWLSHKLYPSVVRTLEEVLHQDVDVLFVPAESLAG